MIIQISKFFLNSFFYLQHDKLNVKEKSKILKIIY
jgi:hypothetical protein